MSNAFNSAAVPHVSVERPSARRRLPPPVPGVASASSEEEEEAAAKRSKRANPLELEVQELLEEKLLGHDKLSKIAALRTFYEYFTESGRSTVPVHQRQDYRRAFVDLNGFHLVLIALRQEIDANKGPSHGGVVSGALEFLKCWYVERQRRDGPMSLKGIERIIRGMQAFPNDAVIQRMAIHSFVNFTRDDDADRRQKLLEAGCAAHVVRAMSMFPDNQNVQEPAICVLKRLCQIGNQRHVGRLIDDGALTAASNAYTVHRTCTFPQCTIREAARSLMNELLK